MASYNWQERLQAPWSPENTPPTFEVMPELPGAFPIDAEVSEARSPTEIFELPGSAIDNIPESNSRLSSLKVPFDERLPQYPVISQVEQLDSIPLQQPRDREAMADEMVRNRPSLTPKGGNSSVSESGKSTMAIVKDSSNPKSRKGSKTTTTPSTNDNVIAIFGLTGSGKSSFISKLTGKEVKIGHGLQSCTSEIEEVQCKIGQCVVTLVDTPGFDDTNRTDTEILRLIASWMKDAYDDKTRLTGIIFLHRISDNKMSGSSYKNLKMFRKLCGTQNLSHVILATTMWDKVTPEEGAAREAELLSEDKWWGQMKSQGSMVKRYDNTMGGAMIMVNELLQMSPMVLTIQKELAVQKKPLIDTMAGRSINADLRDLSKIHEEDWAELMEDLGRAVKDNDNALQQELEATKKKLAEQIATTERTKRELGHPINRRSWWQLSWRCTKCRAKLTKSRGDPSNADCPGCGFSAKFL